MEKEEKKLTGIQPRHQIAYRLSKIMRAAGITSIVFGVLLFILSFVDTLSAISDNVFYSYAFYFLIFLGLLCIGITLLLKVTILKACPFDDWLMDIATRRLGTEVIFYDRKYLWIHYDRTSKEVDKLDFVAEISDKSIHYSYYYIKTFIDEGVLQIQAKVRSPIPTRAMLKPEDDKLWNFFPLGLSINMATQKVSPIGWYINDNQIDSNAINTIPSVSMCVAGTPGCHEKGELIKTIDGFKKVEDIEVGDTLEGVIWNNEVTGLHRGRSKMYEIEILGNKHIVNAGHLFPVQVRNSVMLITAEEYVNSGSKAKVFIQE